MVRAGALRRDDRSKLKLIRRAIQPIARLGTADSNGISARVRFSNANFECDQGVNSVDTKGRTSSASSEGLENLPTSPSPEIQPGLVLNHYVEPNAADITPTGRQPQSGACSTGARISYQRGILCAVHRFICVICAKFIRA
jgi:hypothetical protein